MGEQSSVCKYLMSSYVVAHTIGDHVVPQESFNHWHFDSVQFRGANSISSKALICLARAETKEIESSTAVTTSGKTGNRLTGKHWPLRGESLLYSANDKSCPTVNTCFPWLQGGHGHSSEQYLFYLLVPPLCDMFLKFKQVRWTTVDRGRDCFFHGSNQACHGKRTFQGWPRGDALLLPRDQRDFVRFRATQKSIK